MKKNTVNIYKEKGKLVITIPMDFSDNHMNWDRLAEELKIYAERLIETAHTRSLYETTDKAQQFLQRIENYVASHYTNTNLSLQEIADHMQYSPRYMSQKFKKYSGITISKYILNYRMNKAKELLINSNMSVGNIAKCVGIANENYFYQLFKQHFGCTPKMLDCHRSDE